MMLRMARVLVALAALAPRGPDKQPRKERSDKDRYRPTTCGNCPHDPHVGKTCTHPVKNQAGTGFEECGCTG